MFIKKTKSLCPTCLKPLEAEVFEEDGKVWIKKECPDHGEFKNTEFQSIPNILHANQICK